MSSDRPSVYTPFIRRFTDEVALELRETVQLYNEVHQGHKQSVWAQPDIIEKVNTHIAEVVAEAMELPDNQAVLNALDECTLAVLRGETTVFSFPTIDWPVARLSMKEQVDLRRFLRAKQHFLANQDRAYEQIKLTLALIGAGLIEVLPPLTGDTALTVPLAALLPEPGKFVDRIINAITDKENVTLGLFAELQQQLYENVCGASGVSPHVESKKPLTPAAECKLPREEMIETYLRNTPFYDLLQMPVPFVHPRPHPLRRALDHCAAWARQDDSSPFNAHGRFQERRVRYCHGQQGRPDRANPRPQSA